MGKLNPEEALRYVRYAVWQEGMQGQDGYYEIGLNCGHQMQCSLPMLSGRLVCMECFRKSLERA